MCHNGMEALGPGVSEEPVKRTAEDWGHREELSTTESNVLNGSSWDPDRARSTCAVGCRIKHTLNKIGHDVPRVGEMPANTGEIGDRRAVHGGLVEHFE